MDNPTASARHARPEAENQLVGLREESLEALEERFQRATVPAWDEVEGDTVGRIVMMAPSASAMMRMLGRMTFDSAPSRWCGKRFTTPFGEGLQGAGVNLYDNLVWRRRYPFRTRVEPSLTDAAPCLVIDYPVTSLVHGTRDELRRTDSGVLLGRGYFRPPWRKAHAFLSYFALSPVKGSLFGP
jgi:hypothetical protein